jgi:hypothetical protein
LEGYFGTITASENGLEIWQVECIRGLRLAGSLTSAKELAKPVVGFVGEQAIR